MNPRHLYHEVAGCLVSVSLDLIYNIAILNNEITLLILERCLG